jgi:hypothetical protein
MLWQAETPAAIHAPVARDKSATVKVQPPFDNEVVRALRFVPAGRGVAVGRELLEVTSNKTICGRR